MDTVDPFEELSLPTNASVGLKEGINLSDLQSGAMFEVDMSSVPNTNKEEFNKKEIWRHLNGPCTLGVDGDGDDDLTPFARLEKSMECLTNDKGVMKKIIRMGVGHVIPERCTARVHYNGYLEYADEPYDSTRLRNQPLKIHLGHQEVIPGLEVGVASMKKDELAQFLVRPEYAFGKMGCPPRIPPEATILFEVEVLSFVDSKAAEEYGSLSKDGRDKMCLQEIIKVTKSEKELGNEAFEMKLYGKASKHYSKGIRVIEPVHLKDETEEEQWKDTLVKLYLNLALCDLRQCKSALAITHCRRVLELDSKNMKATFRLGQAYMQLSEWERSRHYLLMAARLSPNNVEIRRELEKLDRKVQQFQLLERKMYSKMFSEQKASEAEVKPSPTATLNENVKGLYQEKLDSFKENVNMKELVLPTASSEEEIECIIELAKEMGLTVERGDKKTSFSVKVTKGVPASQEN